MRDWQALAETSWTAARQKAWLTALVVAKRNIYTCKISPSELSKLRGAWQMYAIIRAVEPVQAHALRERYEYRRFYELYRAWRLYEFDVADCIEYLEFDGGIAGMSAMVEDKESPLDEWQRRSVGIYSTVAKFTTVSYGCPAWFTEWARDTKELFERNGIK